MVQKYCMLFADAESRKMIKREGAVRLLTSVAAILAIAGIVVMFVTSANVVVFFIGVVLTLAILAGNSFYESRFNRVINDLIVSDTEADENSYIRSKCFARYAKYTAYLHNASKLITYFTAIFAAVTLALAIASLFGDNKNAVFIVTGCAVFFYSLVQMVYALSSYIMERTFFSDCKAEFLLLKK